MALTLSYREFGPPPELARWVACFWQIEGAPVPGTFYSHRVLPDGCADVLFDLHPTRQLGGVEGELVGPMSRALVVELHGPVDMLGIRLRPGAVGAFADIPAHQLLNVTAALSELPASLQVNPARLAEFVTAQDRVDYLIQVFRARIAEMSAPDPLINHAMTRLTHAGHGSPAPISLLVRDLGLSERAFERRFASQVGLTPVCFRRLARLRAALRLFAGGSRDWAAAAADTGFSDQSHLVREWQAFVGLSPTEWAATQAGGAGFFQDGQVTAI
jgi:AraC-like DNA-binding protein